MTLEILAFVTLLYKCCVCKRSEADLLSLAQKGYQYQTRLSISSTYGFESDPNTTSPRILLKEAVDFANLVPSLCFLGTAGALFTLSLWSYSKLNALLAGLLLFSMTGLLWGVVWFSHVVERKAIIQNGETYHAKEA